VDTRSDRMSCEETASRVSSGNYLHAGFTLVVADNNCMLQDEWWMLYLTNLIQKNLHLATDSQERKNNILKVTN